MIFYYAITNYHILNCILHKLKYHRSESAILYISKWHPEHKKLIDRLDKLDFFDHVLVFEEVVFPSLNQHISKNQIKSDIEYIVNNISPNLDLEKYNEINVCGDHYGLGVYLVYHKIPYNYFEDGCGILSNESLLMNNIKGFEYSRYQILKSLNIPGNAKNVLNRFGNLDKQLDGYSNSKDIHFSVPVELKKISMKTLKEILFIFCDDSKFDTFDDADLILTFHYNNLGILTLEEQRIFYGYLIDYFSNSKNVVIKPHPSDIQPNYENWYPNAYVLSRSMPSELLPFFIKNKFCRAITGWSTSIYNLSDNFEKVINFNQEIDQTYLQMNQYYAVAYFIKSIQKYVDKNVYTCGINVVQLKNMFYLFNIENIFSFNDEIIEKCEDSLPNIIIKNSNFNVKKIKNSVLKLNHNDLLIYILNEGIELQKILSLDIKDVQILKISKQKITNDVFPSHYLLNDEYLIIFTKNTFLKETIIKNYFNFEKRLLYTNIKLFFTDNLFEILKGAFLEETRKCENLKEKCDELEQKANDFEQQIFDKNDLISKLNKQIDDILSSSSWKLTSLYRKIGAILKKR